MDQSKRFWNRLAVWAYRRLDECRLSTLLALFVVVILAFGIFYTFMTPSGNGVSQTQAEPSDFGFLNGLYFSVVTVSSLGYGDMQPVGYSRIAASIEVLIGLGFIGIMIAKLTSRPITHLVSRVFVSTARNRLAELTDSFHACGNRLWESVDDGAQLYPIIPAQAPPKRASRKGLHEDFRAAVAALRSTSRELQSYINAEAAESVFFRLVPTSSLLKLSVAIEDAVTALGQLVTSLPTRSYPEIFDDMLTRANMIRISDSKIVLNTISNEFMRVDRYGKDAAHAFQRVRDACEKVPDWADVPPHFNRPDQKISHNDLPTTA